MLGRKKDACGGYPLFYCKETQENKPKCELCKGPKVTYGDKIRKMKDEELAELWWEFVDCGECPVHRDCRMTGQDCKKLALDYLRKVEE